MEIQDAPNENNNGAPTADYASYENPPPPKRGRSYAPMGEFDLSLIREFRACPALYDRNSASFRDKLHSAHQWQEISNKLGFDVSLLKDRMLQLRNRYNLEKRRLEQLREENPNQHIDSPWPLFDHLHFLSEHIRPRRSYRSLLPRNSSHADTGDDEDDQPLQSRRPQRYVANGGSGGGGGTGVVTIGRDSFSDGGGGDSVCGNNMTTYADSILTVKMEEPEGDDANGTDVESGSHSGVEETNSGNPLKLSAASTLLTIQKRQQHSMSSSFNKSTVSPMTIKTRSLKYSASSAVVAPQPPTAAIKIRRLDTMQERSASTAAAIQSSQPSRNNIPNNNQLNRNNNDNNNNRNVDRRKQQDSTFPSQRSTFNMQVNRRCLTKSEHKYAAFGEFVTASLLELPSGRALQLVQKFTSEVVRVLLDSKMDSGRSVGIDGGSSGGGGGVSNGTGQQSVVQSKQVTHHFPQMNGGSLGEAVNGV